MEHYHYYTYSKHSTKQKALDAIENYYSDGDISESDAVKIVISHGVYLVQLLEVTYISC